MPPPSTIRLPGPRLADFRSLPGLAGFAMDLFTQLFGSLLAFVYHCFDRIVIYGYLSGLSRPERLVNFFHQVVGVPVVSREILSQRTADYQNWVEAFARNHRIPIEWAEKGVRKEDHVLPWQRRMARADSYGVYYILKSMEQGPTFRVTAAASPTTISTSATKPSARWSCGSPRSCRSRPPITSMVTASSSRSSTERGSAFARPTTPFSRSMTWPRYRPPPIG